MSESQCPRCGQTQGKHWPECPVLFDRSLRRLEGHTEAHGCTSDADCARMRHEAGLQREKSARALDQRRLDLAKAFACARLRGSYRGGATPLGLEQCVRGAVFLADALLDELAKPKATP